MQANNGEFTAELPEDAIILYSDYVKIGEDILEAVYLDDLIELAKEKIQESKTSENVNQQEEKECKFEANKLITQEDFYAQVARYLKDTDVIYGETGTASHGLTEIKIR